MDSLYEYVPRDILPTEYGGEGESMIELKQHWLEVLEHNADFLMNDDYFALTDDETKDEKDVKQKFGGVFRFLSS